MIKVIMTIGLQASGKSTWAKEMCNLDSKYRRVNKDDIRKLLGIVDWNIEEESRVKKLQFEMIKNFINGGFNVIVDNIHLSASSRKELLKDIQTISNQTGKPILIESLYFPIEMEVALERNNMRDCTVPHEVIINTYKKYNWKEISKINIREIIEPMNSFTYIQNENLPKAIIVDVDGTIAEMHNRKPYEWHRVGEDLPKQNIIDIVNLHYDNGYIIIVLSGRDGVCFPETEKWLNDHNVKYNHLYMRSPNDNRNDSIIKEELFYDYVRDKFNVKFVLDDRDRVVKTWRNVIGLTCLQVNFGDF